MVEQESFERRDFFISYTKPDEEWAVWVAWHLEQAGYSTIVQAWDFRPGNNFVVKMDEATRQAEKTIVVLTSQFLKSNFTPSEWAAAFARDPRGEKRLVVPVLVENADVEGLLGQIVYINLTGAEGEEAVSELLAGIQEGRGKPAQAPEFPGRPGTPSKVSSRLLELEPAPGWRPFRGEADLALGTKIGDGGTESFVTEQNSIAQNRRLFRRRLGAVVGVALALVVALIVTSVISDPGYPRAGLSAPSNVTPGDSDYWDAHWGPDREVFELASGGSPYPSFNSITDNPNIGDERGFVGLRQDFGESSAPNVWSDDVWGDVGDEFYMRVYVNNSGSDSNGVVSAGWLQGVRLQVGLSRGVNESSVFGMLSASNATTVWDGATIHYPEGATVEFVPSFRTLENNAHGPDGLQLGPDVFETGGALLGYEEMDGVIRPGYQYAAYVVFRLTIVDAQAQVGTATVSGGWGPERDVVSANGRTPQVTINSMIDNPVHGDERNFFQARPIESSNEEYTDTLGVDGGATYVGYVYVNNNSSGTGSDSVAEDVRLSVLLPAVVTGSAAASATISSSNSSPKQVWDSVVFSMPTPALAGAVRLVPGSATLNTSGSADGVKLDDSVFSAEGALLGCDAVDGKLAPGPDCAGYVTFRFVVDVPVFSITAGGRPTGDGTAFSDAVRTAPGGVVQVQVEYQNTGDTQQDSVVFRVPGLPEGIRYLEGSTEIANEATGGEWRSTLDGIVGNGYNVGSYQPGGNVNVRFNLMVSPEFEGSSGWVEIRPLVRVETSGGYKSANLTLNLL